MSEFLRSMLLKIYIIRQLILVRIVIITVSSKCFSGEFDFYGDFFFFLASCPLDLVDTNDTKSTYRIFYSYYEGLNKKKNIGAFLPEINIHDSVKKHWCLFILHFFCINHLFICQRQDNPRYGYLMALANRVIHSSWESGRSRRDIGNDQNIGKYEYIGNWILRIYIRNIGKYRWIFL